MTNFTHKGLPEMSFAQLPTTGETILIKLGETGYYVQNEYVKAQSHHAMNEQIGVSKAEAEAMSAGSLHGWDCPASDPSRYDEEGMWIRG